MLRSLSFSLIVAAVNARRCKVPYACDLLFASIFGQLLHTELQEHYRKAVLLVITTHFLQGLNVAGPATVTSRAHAASAAGHNCRIRSSGLYPARNQGARL
jgi:hypothetical protein